MSATNSRPAALQDRARPPLKRARSAYAIPVAMDSTPPPGRMPLATDFLPTPPRRPSRLARLVKPLAVALALLGPLLAWQVHDTVERNTLSRRRAELERLTVEQAQRVRERVIACAEALYAMGALYDASQQVDAREFGRFAGRVLARHPAVAFGAWAPRDPGSAATRDRYLVEQIEPQAEFADWQGRDVSEHPAARRAIERALGSAEAVLSDAHETLPGGGGGPGALLVLHVGAGPSTGAGGVVVLGLDGTEVLRGAAAHAAPQDAASILAQLFDADVLGRRASLGSSAPAPASATPELTTESQVHVAGQDWRLLAAATPRLLERISGMSPWLAGMLAFLAWELFVGGLVGVGLGWRGQALQGQARMVGHVLRSLGEGVLVTDRHGQVRLANEAARRMLAESEPAGLDLLPMQTRLLAVEGRDPLAPEQFPLTRALAGEVVAHQDACLRAPGGGAGARMSVSARPLLDEQGALHGAVMVLRDVSDQFARHETKIEMDLAGRIQQRLYPQQPPSAVGLDVAGAVLPATETAGDYYDWLLRPDGSVLFAVGDVSGHGAGPAIVMAEVCSYVRAMASTGREPAEILQHLHETVARNLPDDMFVSLMLLVVDPLTRSVSYANAGHPSGLLLGADGGVKAELAFTGSALRRAGAATFRQVEAPPLMSGDVLTLLTDGVTELRNWGGDMFGEEGVEPVVRASRHERAAGVIARLQEALGAHAGGRAASDDVTLVVVKG